MTRFHSIILVLVALFALGTFPACETGPEHAQNGGGSEDTFDGPTGSVSLTVMAPNGTTPIVGATVSVIGYESISATTDAYGIADLPAVPTGDIGLAIAKGPFYCEVYFTVEEDTLVEDEVAIPADAVSMAVVYGVYDSIELVLERLGFSYFAGSYDLLTANDLASEDKVMDYDIIFIDCGVPLDNSHNSSVQANLAAFVDAGGYLYTSDWSYSYIDAIWPDAVNFVSPDALIGEVGEVVADITDATLAQAMGTDTMDIHFDLGSWAVIDSEGPGTQVHVRADVPTWQGRLDDRPLTVSFTPGAGKVIYTSFHNEAQTTADMDAILEFIVLGL